MRILQISSASSFGGGERYLVDLSNSLAARGHEVFAVVRPNSPLPYQLKLPKENIKHIALRNALDAPSARHLDHFVKQHQIEVIHAHMARDYSLAAYATRRNPPSRLFVTRHVLFPLSSLHSRTLAHATCVIAVSEAVGRQLSSQRLVEQDRIAVVRNGIDVDRFDHAFKNFNKSSFLQKLVLPENTLLVGSIGELRALKRHDDFIRAAALVSKEFQDAHFVIAGIDTSPKGEVRHALKRLVTQLQLQDRVHFLGWLDDAEQLLFALDVFVSASETESFGLAIAEAMTAHTAVVATATEGASEVVVENETGFLVPIGDVDKLAEGIARLLRDNDLRNSFGKRGRQVVEERFSLERMVDEIERLYQKAAL